MTLLSLFVTLIVVGVALYLTNRFVPMDAKIKTILNWAVVIIVILWLLSQLGILGSLETVRVGG